MHYSTIAAILLAATVAANPIASPALDEPAQPRGLTVTKEGVSPISDADLQQRGLTVTNKGLTPITDSDLATRAAALEASGIEKRDGIHRCGPRSGWTPIETHGDKIGFLDAITAYCNEVDGLKVPKGYKNAAQVDGITLTSGKKGSLTGQVFNVHINGGYVIKASDCIGSLRQFTHAGAKCFGKNNQDTKGGWTDVDSLGNWYAYPWENKQLH